MSHPKIAFFKKTVLLFLGIFIVTLFLDWIYYAQINTSHEYLLWIGIKSLTASLLVSIVTVLFSGRRKN